MSIFKNKAVDASRSAFAPRGCRHLTLALGHVSSRGAGYSAYEDHSIIAFSRIISFSPNRRSKPCRAIRRAVAGGKAATRCRAWRMIADAHDDDFATRLSSDFSQISQQACCKRLTPIFDSDAGVTNDTYKDSSAFAIYRRSPRRARASSRRHSRHAHSFVSTPRRLSS